MKRTAKGRLKCSAWLAVFAILVQAFLPAVLHASAPRVSHLSEICTAFGIKKIAVQESSEPDIETAQHCPVCPATAEILSLLPPQSVAVFVPPARLALSLQPVQQSFCTGVWLRPYLRGPPASA